MRHTAACTFSHVDPDVVTNFGFLPQDMLGKSIFDFYHPEDMPFLKEIYESGEYYRMPYEVKPLGNVEWFFPVMKMCQIAGSVFRSKPYRFAVQNGGFAMIETEWSSFVNPWSRRLEFVIGLHRVLQVDIRKWQFFCFRIVSLNANFTDCICFLGPAWSGYFWNLVRWGDK